MKPIEESYEVYLHLIAIRATLLPVIATRGHLQWTMLARPAPPLASLIKETALCQRVWPLISEPAAAVIRVGFNGRIRVDEKGGPQSVHKSTATDCGLTCLLLREALAWRSGGTAAAGESSSAPAPPMTDGGVDGGHLRLAVPLPV